MQQDEDSQLLKQNIKTYLQENSRFSDNPEYLEWFSTVLESLSSAFRTMLNDSDEFTKAFMSDMGKETSECNKERLKWIRYRQSRSNTIDDIVKRKDELARLIKKGEINPDHLITSAAEGDPHSLITVYPFWNYVFQTYEPYWWEKFIIFLLRRKVDTNPS